MKEREINIAQGALRIIETNLSRYQAIFGFLPSQEQGLKALVKRPSGKPEPRPWHQFMDSSALVDSWGNLYLYCAPGKRRHESFDIYSMGPDGQEGTEDDIYP